MKMAKAIISGMWWVGRGSAMVMGLAVMLALVVGVGTTALAAVPGDPFRLGKTNGVNNALTALAGKNPGPMLRVDNDSAATNARALSLGVQPGRPPLTVNASAGTATNLDADRLDGKDPRAFFSGETYEVEDGRVGPGGGRLAIRSVSCDEGDVMLNGGGGGSTFDGDDLRFSSGSGKGGWSVFVQDNNSPSGVVAEGLCADFPPLR